MTATLGRRERNKQEKLQRIIAAASELLADRGIDDVTTQEIAERADIGAGTLFLYAKTKGELLLLVQNSAYADAHERGVVAAAACTDTVEAVLALARPIVECNRTQIDNGRTYLREIVFGDPSEPNHRAAIERTAATESAMAAILERDGAGAEQAAVAAKALSAIMFLTLASPLHLTMSVDALVAEIAAPARTVIASAAGTAS